MLVTARSAAFSLRHPLPRHALRMREDRLQVHCLIGRIYPNGQGSRSQRAGLRQTIDLLQCDQFCQQYAIGSRFIEGHDDLRLTTVCQQLH